MRTWPHDPFPIVLTPGPCHPVLTTVHTADAYLLCGRTALGRHTQRIVNALLAVLLLSLPFQALAQVAPLLTPIRSFIHEYPGDCCQEKGVWSTALSPDGNTLVSYHEQSVWLWDTKSGKKIRVLNGHQADVRHVALSRDGALLASAARDGSVLVWDAKTGKQLRSLAGLTGLVDALAMGDAGRVVAMGREGKIIVWQPNGAIHSEVSYDRKTTTAQAFSADGSKVALYRTDSTIRLIDLNKGTVIATIGTPGKRPASRAIAFSADGKTLAFGTGSDGKVVGLWSLGTDVDNISGGPWEAPAAVAKIAFSPDGRWLALAVQDLSEGYSIYILDGRSYALAAVLQGDTWAADLSFSRDGRTLAAATGGEKQVHLWATPAGMTADLKASWARYSSNLKNATQHDASDVGSRDGLSFSPDGNLLAGTTFHRLYLWDVASRTLRLAQKESNGNFVPLTYTRAQFLPDGKTLATFTSDRAARFWDVERLKVSYVTTPTGVREGLAGFAPGIAGENYLLPIATYASSIGSGIFAKSNHDGFDTFEVRQVGSNKLVSSFVKRDGTEGEWVSGFAFDDKRNLIYGCNANGIVVMDGNSGRQRAVFEQAENIGDRCTLGLSNDGRWLVQTAAYQMLCAVWDTRNGQRLIHVRMAGVSGSLQAAALSADGKTLLCGNMGDPSVSINVAAYDVASNKRLWVIPQYIIGRVSSLAIHPNGKTFAAGGDAKITFWDLATGQPATH